MVEEYKSSLADLTFNSKVHITMLTMLAEDNVQYSQHIVSLIEAHLHKVLYLFISLILPDCLEVNGPLRPYIVIF